MQKDSVTPPLSPILHSGDTGDRVSANGAGSEVTQTLVGSSGRSNLPRALVHDLRNAVAPIRNAVHLLRFRSREDPDLTQITDIIDRQVNAIVRLLNGPDTADQAGGGDPKSAADIHAVQGQNHDSAVPKL